MAPTVRASTGVGVNSATATAATPAVQNGDVLVLIGFSRASASVTTPPDGFVPIVDAASGTTGTHARIVAYQKVVPDAGSEPASHAIGYSQNILGCVMAVSVAGADPAGPVNVFALLPDTDQTNTVASPSATTTIDDSLLLRIAAMNRSETFAPGSWAPTDAVELQDVVPGGASGQRTSGALARETAVTAGATGAETWTIAGTTWGLAVGVTIAIAPPVLTADAGNDQTVDPGQLVTLDGTGSQNATTYIWTQTAGTPDVAAYLVGADTATATCYAPQGLPSDLTFQLQVGDGTGTALDTTVVTLRELPVAAPLNVKVNTGSGWA